LRLALTLSLTHRTRFPSIGWSLILGAP
jgi:hypothetical protein